MKKDVFPTIIIKGQVSDQKSNGRIHLTNAVQAVKGCPEIHTAVSKLPAKILGMFCGHAAVEEGFICYMMSDRLCTSDTVISFFLVHSQVSWYELLASL